MDPVFVVGTKFAKKKCNILFFELSVNIHYLFSKNFSVCGKLAEMNFFLNFQTTSGLKHFNPQRGKDVHNAT